jgi:hypothetical protein
VLTAICGGWVRSRGAIGDGCDCHRRFGRWQWRWRQRRSIQSIPWVGTSASTGVGDGRDLSLQRCVSRRAGRERSRDQCGAERQRKLRRVRSIMFPFFSLQFQKLACTFCLNLCLKRRCTRLLPFALSFQPMLSGVLTSHPFWIRFGPHSAHRDPRVAGTPSQLQAGKWRWSTPY